MKRKRIKPKVYDWESSKVVNEIKIIMPRTGTPATSRLLEDKNGQLMGEIEINFTLYAKPLDK